MWLLIPLVFSAFDVQWFITSRDMSYVGDTESLWVRWSCQNTSADLTFPEGGYVRLANDTATQHGCDDERILIVNVLDSLNIVNFPLLPPVAIDPCARTALFADSNLTTCRALGKASPSDSPMWRPCGSLMLVGVDSLDIHVDGSDPVHLQWKSCSVRELKEFDAIILFSSSVLLLMVVVFNNYMQSETWHSAFPVACCSSAAVFAALRLTNAKLMLLTIAGASAVGWLLCITSLLVKLWMPSKYIFRLPTVAQGYRFDILLLFTACLNAPALACFLVQ